MSKRGDKRSAQYIDEAMLLSDKIQLMLWESHVPISLGISALCAVMIVGIEELKKTMEKHNQPELFQQLPFADLLASCDRTLAVVQDLAQHYARTYTHTVQ